MIAWAALAFGAVATDDPPREGIETVITLTDEHGDPASGETVRVVHRPSLAGEKELAIGITDGRGRVRWTPAEPGLARLRAGEEVQDVRILPAQAPTTTLVLIVLLAVAGVVAAALGLAERRR